MVATVVSIIGKFTSCIKQIQSVISKSIS